MKVKTFAGSETAKVDKRVNDWLARCSAPLELDSFMRRF